MPRSLFIAVALFAACLTGCNGCCKPNDTKPPVVVTTPSLKADRAVYVYEKDDGEVPSEVRVALNRINRERNILATAHDDDTTDGTGEIPEQYKQAVPAAREAGLPAIVVQSGNVVLKVVSKPTAAQIMESVE